MRLFLGALLMATGFMGCEPEPTYLGSQDDNNGNGNNGDTSGNQAIDPNSCDSILIATIRDFPATHPDFYHDGSTQPTLNMVEIHLDAEDKPIMKTPSETFQHVDEWYRDIPGVNQTFITEIPLTETDTGVFT